MTTMFDEILARLSGEFIDEAIDRINRVQVALENLRGGGLSHMEAMVDVSREIHSIKGSAGSFNFPLVTRIAGKFEDFISDTSELPEPPIRDMQIYAEQIADILDRKVEPQGDDAIALIHALPVAAPEFDPTGVSANPGQALVVTSARALGRMLARELANCGYHSDVVSDPFEAMRLAVTKKPDIILTSAVLDGLNGVDLMRAMLGMRQTAGVPKAVVTSFDADHIELRGLPKHVGVVRLGAHVSDDLASLLTQAE
jgi:CheY-like chemotaxis protein/HPt (histidine-containing phosphotransfer) domain-containing protein